jgi:hypothetical protein
MRATYLGPHTRRRIAHFGVVRKDEPFDVPEPMEPLVRHLAEDTPKSWKLEGGRPAPTEPADDAGGGD